jgi:hypothetical protein
MVANLPFTGALREAQVREQALYPGREVAIRYDVDSVEWV